MQAKDMAKTALTSTQFLLQMYLGDLSDADLLVRPVPNANHTAWQLGHLIGSEKKMLEGFLPGAQFPELPTSIMSQLEIKGSATAPTGRLIPYTSIRRTIAARMVAGAAART